ncbi:hypothetical protein, partial [Escherichia coli]|uniref:hypothetical protein n=1 Tax=Escherichia coli TaxID=562 RepID=UPI003D9B61CC
PPFLLPYLCSPTQFNLGLPQNGKPALSPRHDCINTGSLLQNVPLRIWFYPQ